MRHEDHEDKLATKGTKHGVVEHKDCEARMSCLRCVLVLGLLVAACSPTRGCVESNFTLSPESRLPKWFASAGVPRNKAIVMMDYYSGPFGGSATFTLRDSTGRKVAGAVGWLQRDEPLTLEPHGETGPLPYPLYEVITVNGITEVIEHRRMEPTFYITDDPEVRNKFGVR